jgi:hypothetical protein
VVVDNGGLQFHRCLLLCLAGMLSKGRPRQDADLQQIPEIFRPGRFDTYGSSHQIMHIMIVFAALAHMIGLFRAYEHTHAMPR